MIKTPFTLDQFLDVFKQYNEAVFPAQILFYLVALAAMYLAIKPTATSDRWIAHHCRCALPNNHPGP